jgi:ABC-type multidrug transport system ATPase subunit
MGAVTISFRGVRFGYEPGTRVLDIPELDVPAGLTLLLGPNGAGKTTLMRLAAGVERPDEGVVSIGGVNLWTDEIRARRSIAYVPEQPDLTPYATLSEILTLVARLRGVPESAASSALESVGLAALGGRTIRELSQGQRRRAVWGAAMVGSPCVFILDEPLESLDVEMRGSLLRWVGSAVERGATVLVSTHDVAAFGRWAVGTVRIDSGRIVG